MLKSIGRGHVYVLSKHVGEGMYKNTCGKQEYGFLNLALWWPLSYLYKLRTA